MTPRDAIGVVDYGMGNLRSVSKALESMGFPTEVSGDSRTLSACRGIVFPGVGAFRDCMANVVRQGLLPFLREYLTSDRPFLGICVGMQLLFGESEEGGKGLGLLAGSVCRVRARRVPHMGWNTLKASRPSVVLDGLDGADVYFAHSYAVEPEDGDVVAATADHDGPIVAAVESGPLAGVQFHPERSATAGARILDNLVRWSRSA